jgi:predicted phage terminase large subunit-like protein
MIGYSRAELIDMRIQCDDSLMYFTRLFFRELRGQRFGVGLHHERICTEIDKVMRYETRFLNINVPPRHSKTELILNAIARSLGQNPKGNNLYITASDELRAEVSVRIREIVSSPLFYLLYGVKLKKDQQSKNVWRTDQGGGLKTATIFGQITGFGAGQMKDEDITAIAENIIDREFEGGIYLDDIDKIMDAEKQTANNKKTHDTIFNTILSRVNSMDTPVVNIQQRAGEEDSTDVLLKHYGRMKDQSKVVNLVMPVINPDGSPLWPAKMDLEEIEFTKNSPFTAHVFETQYMQNPTSPKGKPFHKSKLKYFYKSELEWIRENSEGCISYVDAKDEGEDYYSHPLGHIIGDTIYITDVVHNQFNTDITIPKSVAMINENRCKYTMVESNSMGAMVFKWISKKVRSSVRPIANTTNKETRISTYEAGIIKHMRFMKDYEPHSEYSSFMDKLCKFEYGKTGGVDDAPDSAAGLQQFFMMKYRHLFDDGKRRKKDRSAGKDEEE